MAGIKDDQKKTSLFYRALCLGFILVIGFLVSPAQADGSARLTAQVGLAAFNISVIGINDSHATISWQTNGDADSTINFGATTGYGSVSTDNTTSTNHTVSISGLPPGTVTHFQIVSVSPFGDAFPGSDNRFTTTGSTPKGSVAATTTSSTDFNGTDVSVVNGAQQVNFSLTGTDGSVQVTGNTVVVQNPGSGWSQMQVTGSRVTNDSGTISVGQIQNVVLQSTPVSTNLGGTTGTVTAGLKISLTQLVAGASLQQNIVQGANNSVTNAFQLAAASGNLNIQSIAYTVEFLDTAILNSHLGTDPVILDLSVDHAWVAANAPDGNANNIRIIRFADDGTKEVLITRYLGSQGTTDNFEAQSPHGLSVFGMASVTSSAPSSGPGSGPGSSPGSGQGSSGSSGGDSDAASGTGSHAGQQENLPAPPQPGSGPVVSPGGPQVTAQPQETLHAPAEQGSRGGQPGVPGISGTGSGGFPGGIMAFVREHLIPITAVAGGILAVMVLLVLVWQKRRE
jgi:hypothetical protein